MATNVKFRIVAVVAAFTILLGVYTAKLWRPDVRFNNFYIYYTAADFVRSNESIHIYDACLLYTSDAADE